MAIEERNTTICHFGTWFRVIMASGIFDIQKWGWDGSLTGGGRIKLASMEGGGGETGERNGVFFPGVSSQ